MLVVYFSSNKFSFGSVYFSPWGKSCTGAILPSVEHYWLEWLRDDMQTMGQDLRLVFTQS